MERGRDFLRQQVEHAAAQHRVLVESIESDKENADDTRVRELCAQYLPRVREHQVALDSYRDSLGEGAGATKVMAAVGSFIGRAREAVGGMREDDFGRLTDDLTSIRQSQDTFSLFANAGEKINEPRLAEIGRHGARDHEEMQKDFYDLAQTIFLEQTSMESGGGRAAAD